jgi:hypothetical protein
MDKPIINSFSTIAPLIIQQYERYLPTAFDESLSILEKVNKVINYLDTTNKVSNDLITQWNAVMVWVMADGLNDSVIAKIDDMVVKGTFDDIINHQIFDDLTAKIDTVTDQTSGIKNVKSFATFLDSLNVLNSSRLLIPAGSYNLDVDVDLTLQDFQLEGLGRVDIYLTQPTQTVKLTIKHCDIRNIYFHGLGKTFNQTIHLSTYRMNMFNCRFEDLNTFKTNSVYNYFNDVHYLNNANAFVPINLDDVSSPISTMYYLQNCVFYGNDVGVWLGKDGNEPPLRMSLIHCGFELNGTGIQQDKMTRLGEIKGCWFEQNSNYHANLISYAWVLETNRINDAPEKFVLRPFDTSTVSDGVGGYTDITQSAVSTNTLNLQNILGSRSLVKGTGTVKVNSVDHVNGSFKQIPSAHYNYLSDDASVNVSKSLVYTDGQEYNSRATIFIDSDGVLKKSSFHLPLTVIKVTTGQYRISWDATKYIMYPHIDTKAYTRSTYPNTFKSEFAVTLNTNNSDWFNYGKMNEITVFTFDSTGVAIDTAFSIDMSYTIENF